MCRRRRKDESEVMEGRGVGSGRTVIEVTEANEALFETQSPSDSAIAPRPTMPKQGEGEE